MLAFGLVWLSVIYFGQVWFGLVFGFEWLLLVELDLFWQFSNGVVF